MHAPKSEERDPGSALRWRARTPPSPRRRIALLAVVTFAVVLNALVPVNDALAALGVVAIVAVLWEGGRAVRRRTRDQSGWRGIYLGVVLAASGMVPFTLREMLGFQVPQLVGHLLLFSSYTACAAGLVRLARPAGERRERDVDAMVDMAVVAVLAAVLLWQFVGRTVFITERLGPELLALTLTHSIFIVVLLAVITRVVIQRSGSLDTYLLAAGVTCLTVANLSYLTHVEASDIGSWAATAWLAGMLLLGLAVAFHGPRPLDRTATDDRLLPLGRVALSLAPVPVPVVLALASDLPTETYDLWTIAAATVALAGLALLRASRLARSAREAWTHLAARERLFQVLATNSSDAVLRVDRDGTLPTESLLLPALTRGGQTVQGERSDIAIDLASLEGSAYDALLARAISTPGTPSFAELPVRDRHGAQLWVAARAVDLVHDAAVGAVVINLHDITERKRAEEELTYQALHDPLTGLPNRALFLDRLERALVRRSRHAGQTGLLYLDLDGFKDINDGLGHETGDRLLRQVADRLAGVTRADETVARLGGDEFAILVEVSDQAREDAQSTAERVITALHEPFELEGRRISISVSVGIAISDGGSTATTLLRNADVAMYQAKAAGRGRWLTYEAALDKDTQEQLQLENDLGGALGRDEFEVYYQPIVQLASDRTVGFEALLRWNHPTRGLLPPDRFIPLLERSGAIVEVGGWVLHTACHTLAGWQRRFGADLTVSVNVSGRQLERPDLVARVEAELTSSGIRPADLMLEMTETFLVDNDLAAEQLGGLHALGVRIAIDDFGTGYSALSYLRRYPIDTIKIDRSFISAIEDIDGLPPLVKGLLDLGRTLEMDAIAEGIELELQRDLLRAQGCVLGQGYLYARPLPTDQAERHLAQRAPVITTASVERSPR